jgi:hypothetical protein
MKAMAETHRNITGDAKKGQAGAWERPLNPKAPVMKPKTSGDSKANHNLPSRKGSKDSSLN